MEATAEGQDNRQRQTEIVTEAMGPTEANKRRGRDSETYRQTDKETVKQTEADEERDSETDRQS